MLLGVTLMLECFDLCLESKRYTESQHAHICEWTTSQCGNIEYVAKHTMAWLTGNIKDLAIWFLSGDVVAQTVPESKC